YVMDLISPKVYRMISNIAHESALKIETTVISTCANLKRPAPCPPLYWLSNDSFVLSRATKKLKK
ncbi:hypothetical protein K501DRAFT_162714, partial [Backusella circina FSU 941]